MQGPVVERRAVRAVMVTPDHHVLLMRVQAPLSGRSFWITPGGGIERHEDVEAALRREIEEETGVTECRIGPLIWTRRHRFAWDGKMIDQREQYYLVQIGEFSPTMSDPKELKIHRGFRWWTIDEVRSSNQQFAPRKLGALLEELVHRGAPEVPIDVGV